MPVKFSDTFVCDTSPTMTLEDVYRMYGAFAGVHQFAFDSTLDERWSNLDAWTVENGTWGVSDGKLTCTPAATPDYSILWWDELSPSNFAIDVEYTANSDHVCIIFRGSSTTSYYMLAMDPLNIQFIKVTNGTPEVISNLEDVYVGHLGPGTLRLAVRETSFSGYDYDRWLFASVSLDDMWLLSCQDNIAEAVPGYKLGFACRYDATLEIASARIPDLTMIVPTATLDPNEAAMSAIQRAVVDRVVKSFVRYNGTLRAWIPKPTSVVQIFDASGERQLNVETNVREIANYIRLYYALDWVEAFDEDLLAEFGTRFAEVQSAVIETEKEAYDEAVAIMRRLYEAAYRASLTEMRGGLLLEPEDRITMPNGIDYIVDGLDWRYDQHTIITSINGRLYAFDE